VANYNVDIALAVKGAKQLKDVRRNVTQLSKEISTLNKLSNKQSKTLPNSFLTLNKLVKQVKNNFDKAAIGTKRYNDAAKQLVDVEAKYNNELRKRERLLNKLRQQRVPNTIQGQNVQASRTARAGSGFASFSKSVDEKFGAGSTFRKLERDSNLTAKNTGRMATILTQQAAAANFDSLAAAKPNLFNRLGFGRNAMENAPFAMKGGAMGRVKGGFGSAMIGGGFPLLFGGGGASAVAGGIAGGLGGALAPGGGFAASILATAIVSQVEKVKAFRKEVEQLNDSILATGSTSSITRQQVKALAKELQIKPEEALERLKSFDPVRFGGEGAQLLERAFGTKENLELVSGLKDTDSLMKAIVNARSVIGEKASIELLNQLKTNDGLDIELKLLNKILDANKSIRDSRRKVPVEMGRVNTLIRNPTVFENFVNSMRENDPGDPRGLLLRREASYSSVNELFFTTSLTESALARLEQLGGMEKLKKDFFTFLTDEDRDDYAELKSKITEFFNIIDQNNEKLQFLAEFKAPAQEIENLLNPMRAVLDLSNQIKIGFEDSFKGIIKGTMSVSDAFRSMLNRIADYFLDTAARLLALQVQKSFLGLFSNMFSLGDPTSVFAGMNRGATDPNTLTMDSFANGGRPPVGRPSLVGERGAELFVPDRAGTIIPNHELGGSTNIVVNVDASGSSVEGDEENGRELGRMISVAIQSELIKQKRPGGLLT
jgi:hypothetical protein